MPYVKIQITREGSVTPEKKLALIQGTTRLLVDVLDKDPAHTFVVIEEVDTDNWGVGYDSVTQLRRRSASK